MTTTNINMDQILAYTLITGIETHIGGWLKPQTELKGADTDALSERQSAVLADLANWGGDETDYHIFVCPLADGGGTIVFVDDEDERHEVGSAEISKAVSLMHDRYPHHYADLISEQGDAWTADLLLQLACYGEERYA